jgi:hypothetical protein
MIPPQALMQAGVLPYTKSPIRFAVGDPNGLTSNAWRIWASKAGDVYIACRDNFKETKVSLHASGRWRMGFTTEAIDKNPLLVGEGQNRAWDVWDKPPEKIPNTVQAFQLVFTRPQLVVSPYQRAPKKWKNVTYIEAPPIGKLTVVTLFVTKKNIKLIHETEPSFWLASLDLGNEYYAQLVAHGEIEGNMPELVSRTVEEARKKTKSAGIAVPKDAYGYFFGQRDDGTRFIFGAPV